MSRSRARVAVARFDVASRCGANRIVRPIESIDVSRDARVRARRAADGAWTHDARNRVALRARRARLRYVSRADVKFMHDEIFERECYAVATTIADAARERRAS